MTHNLCWADAKRRHYCETKLQTEKVKKQPAILSQIISPLILCPGSHDGGCWGHHNDGELLGLNILNIVEGTMNLKKQQQCHFIACCYAYEQEKQLNLPLDPWGSCLSQWVIVNVYVSFKLPIPEMSGSYHTSWWPLQASKHFIYNPALKKIPVEQILNKLSRVWTQSFKVLK